MKESSKDPYIVRYPGEDNPLLAALAACLEEEGVTGLKSPPAERVRTNAGRTYHRATG